jgi:hypothetical protein
MKKLLKTSLFLALMAGLVIVVGCSDDDESTNPAEKQVGSVDDVEYIQMTAAMDELDYFSDQMLEFMLLGIDTILGLQGVGSPGRPNRQFHAVGVEVDSVFVIYHASTQYWYLYFEGEETEGPYTITVTVEDSIQFLHATGPVQWPDSALLTGVNNGILLSMESSSGDLIAANQRLSVTGELLTAGDVAINGTQGFDAFIPGPDGGCTLDLNVATTFTALGLNIEYTKQGGCPETGTMRHTGTIGISCVGPPQTTYNESWMIAMTFTGNDNYTIVAENSTTRWTDSGNCLDDYTY